MTAVAAVDVAAILLFAIGLAIGLGAQRLAKRAAGIVCAYAGAALALLSAGAGDAAGAFVAVLAFAAPTLAFALAIRVREAYGVADLDAADAMDDADDRAERAP